MTDKMQARQPLEANVDLALDTKLHDPEKTAKLCGYAASYMRDRADALTPGDMAAWHRIARILKAAARHIEVGRHHKGDEECPQSSKHR